MSGDIIGKSPGSQFQSSNLTEQYQTIGKELCNYERHSSGYSPLSLGAVMSFREGVVFIPVEVLESYLEDLLDLKIKEEKLFIYRERSAFRAAFGITVWIICAIFSGLVCARLGFSSAVCYSTAISVAAFFALLWFLATRNSLLRRIGFARVLSYEISRRRGHDEDGRSRAGLVLKNFLRSGRMRGASETARVRTLH